MRNGPLAENCRWYHCKCVQVNRLPQQTRWDFLSFVSLANLSSTSIIIASMIAIMKNLKAEQIFMLYGQDFQVRACIAFKCWAGYSGQLNDASSVWLQMASSSIQTAALTRFRPSSWRASVHVRKWGKISFVTFAHSSTLSDGNYNPNPNFALSQ